MAGLERFRYINGLAMSEGSEITTAQGLTEAQRRAIIRVADIRRGVQTLGKHLDAFMQSSSIAEVPLPLKTAFQQQHDLVTGVMRGTFTDSNLDEARVASYLASANDSQDTVPNLAGLQFAKAASYQQSTGQDYSETLAKAKECLARSEKQGLRKITPADYLADAYVLGIEKRATKDVTLPSPTTVASAIETDTALVADYALMLPEEEREAFLAALPKNKRISVSLQLDKAVSSVLDGALIEEETDVAQREAVKARVEEIFSEALTALKTPFPEGANAEGRALGSRWSSRQLTETLVNLGEEDSVRLLKDLSEQTTRELKSLNKELRKKSPRERRHALRPAISFTARVLDTLIDADIRRGGVLTMRYLEMTSLPERLFNYFADKLIAKEYFTQNLSQFLKEEKEFKVDEGKRWVEKGRVPNEKNIKVIKKLMAKYGPQFNTIIDTISQIPDYTEGGELATHETELFEALEDLSTLTPRIFARYRQLPTVERKNFTERIRVLKPQFFRNTPIKELLGREDRDILTEMVYMAYKPMGMSFDQVEQLINRVDDHTDDLASYKFPQEGYPISLERQGRYVVKEQQQLDLAALRQYRTLFMPIEKRGTEEKPLSYAEAVRQLLQPQAESQVGTGRQPERNQNEALRHLLGSLQNEERIQTFLNRYPIVSADNAYQMGSELAELTGVYFRDNYSRVLTEYFTSHPAAFQQLFTLLNDTAIRSAINSQLQQSNLQLNWQELDATAQPVSRGLLDRFFPRSTPLSADSQPVVAGILAQFIENTQLNVVQKDVKNELSKFTLNAEETSSYRGALKAYVSKNVGSFFAKAAAGICTAQDISLFERDDHFHINVVENDETVRANIQAYIEPIKGKPVLILRGFNPTADWVGKIDIEGFCEQILRVGKQFQQDNGLGGVFITEQSGGWHALSNRDGVSCYLTGKYIDGKRGTPFKLKVAENHSIETIYQIA